MTLCECVDCTFVFLPVDLDNHGAMMAGGELQQPAVYWNTMNDSKCQNSDTDENGKRSIIFTQTTGSKEGQSDSTKEEQLLSAILINIYLFCLIFYQTTQ